MDFGMQRPVEANSLQFSQIRIPCPHRRKDMMPTLFAALCQMSKMSRVHRVLEWVRVRFGICCLLVRCRGNVSPTPSPEWVGSEVWKLMASCQMSRTCQTFRYVLTDKAHQPESRENRQLWTQRTAETEGCTIQSMRARVYGQPNRTNI